MSTTTVLFISAGFTSHRLWDHWKLYFGNLGYAVHVPTPPFMDAPAEVLRNRQPDADIASIALADVMQHYESIIKALRTKPIVICHGSGAVIGEILISKKLVSAAVLINPIGRKTRFSPSVLRLMTRNIFFSASKASWLISFRDWQNAVANGLSEKCQRESYYALAVPESRKVAKELYFKSPKSIEGFGIPIFVMAAKKDRLAPSSLVYRSYKTWFGKGSNRYWELQDHNGHLWPAHAESIAQAAMVSRWIENLQYNAQP